MLYWAGLISPSPLLWDVLVRNIGEAVPANHPSYRGPDENHGNHDNHESWYIHAWLNIEFHHVIYHILLVEYKISASFQVTSHCTLLMSVPKIKYKKSKLEILTIFLVILALSDPLTLLFKPQLGLFCFSPQLIDLTDSRLNRFRLILTRSPK